MTRQTNSPTLALTPALSPEERVNHSPVSWNVVRWYWQEVVEQSEAGRWQLPLLGERAGVREDVKHSSAQNFKTLVQFLPQSLNGGFTIHGFTLTDLLHATGNLVTQLGNI